MILFSRVNLHLTNASNDFHFHRSKYTRSTASGRGVVELGMNSDMGMLNNRSDAPPIDSLFFEIVVHSPVHISTERQSSLADPTSVMDLHPLDDPTSVMDL